MGLRLLHTADWHLGRETEGFSRLNEQRAVLQEMVSLAREHQVDAVLLAGDVFDTYNPSAEAEDVFYETVVALSEGGNRPVLVIGGNHDHQHRLEAAAPVLVPQGIVPLARPEETPRKLPPHPRYETLATGPGFLELKWFKHTRALRVLLTPFANPARLGQRLPHDQALRDYLTAHWQTALSGAAPENRPWQVLMAHQFVMAAQDEKPPLESESERVIAVGGSQAVYAKNFPPSLDYVALGHLHRRQAIHHPSVQVWYAGSPLCYSISEEMPKSVTLVDLPDAPTAPPTLTEIPLKEGLPVLSHQAKTVSEGLAWLAAHQQAYVQLSIEVEDFLASADRQALFSAHPRMLSLRPVLAAGETQVESGADTAPVADLYTLDMMTVFQRFYRELHNQPPPDHLLTAWKRVIADEQPEASA